MEASEEEFQEAQMRVKSLTAAPGTEHLLQLYGWYKQATVGDVSGKRPSMLDMKGRAKYDAWAKGKRRIIATGREVAMSP
ncbi:MAG: acyl-CoA-binding protein [Myxococcota bacterium]